MHNSEEQLHLIYGIRPVIEAIESGKEIDRIFVQKSLTGANFQELWSLIKEYKIPFKYVPNEKLKRFTTYNHQGVVAFVSAVTFQRIEDLLPEIYSTGVQPLLLVLDRITDVRNIGAIVRSAECSGVQAVIIGEKHAAPMTGDAVKSSAGALLRMPICREKSLIKAIDYLKDSGIQIVASTEKTDSSLYDIDFSLPTAIVMGSEEDGISHHIMQACDSKARIPMMGSIGSLNVSVAAGIALFEAVRQRQ